MQTNILIVDDEKEIVQVISLYLQNEGFNIYSASNGLEGLELIQKETINLIILDIMMPEMDGLEVCKKIRIFSSIPILMLSAKAEDLDKIMGLMTGADDYMIKPFNPLELIARVKALLRRAYSQNFNNQTLEGNIIKINSLEINREKHYVKAADNFISFTSIEFEILYLLASHPGRVFSSEEIFEMVWKDIACDSNKTVIVHISNIREKLQKALEGERIIHTVWGVGYKIDK
ncbi:response regulator transcription factor [Bacillus thuringiensis]|uniref:response regulator transcription factor n=1 Tax=Bacillus thuringiensis TaxID=1428 RepID=UPI000E499ECA|nr:response regulator transcription factor [Bacillus thuringiensis]MDZ3953401.1 response regulator transcription factor [Bacillus thuringiensis]RGP43382.1 DNA-binding response regulator [Bacillus thuringiensis]